MWQGSAAKRTLSAGGEWVFQMGITMKSLAGRGALRARLGATTVEYTVMLALLSVVLIALAVPFAQQLKTTFARANAPIANVNAPPAAATASTADADDNGDAATTADKAAGKHHGKHGHGHDGHDNGHRRTP